MRKFFLALFLISLVYTQFSCRRLESFENNLSLNFSRDTVIFDTVFTTVGSTTQLVKIYNNLNEAVNIENVFLGGGENSPFRMNVNGISGKEVRNVEMFKKDSLFIFLEVTIDPNNGNNPLIVRDSIIFTSGGKMAKIQLVAWGQDAYFHLNDFITENTTWLAQKPHVCYGYTVIDTNITLTVEPGTQVFMHGRSGIATLKGGKIIAESTRDNPIIFQGDRRESFYENIPGQWERIWLIEGNNSSFKNVIIKNAIRGLQVDTVDFVGTPAVNLENCIIQNSSAVGILAQAGAYINAENLLVRDAGQSILNLNSGGTFNFRHCTFANYYSFGGRTAPTLVFRNYFEGPNNTLFVRPVTNTRFDNCIFWGPIQNEFLVDMIEEGSPNFVFNHCIAKTNLTYDDPSRYNNMFFNNEPGFLNISEKIFGLSENAFARGIGDPNFSNFEDLNGTFRPGIPSIGAFEFLPE